MQGQGLSSRQGLGSWIVESTATMLAEPEPCRSSAVENGRDTGSRAACPLALRQRQAPGRCVVQMPCPACTGGSGGRAAHPREGVLGCTGLGLGAEAKSGSGCPSAVAASACTSRRPLPSDACCTKACRLRKKPGSDRNTIDTCACMRAGLQLACRAGTGVDAGRGAAGPPSVTPAGQKQQQNKRSWRYTLLLMSWLFRNEA